MTRPKPQNASHEPPWGLDGETTISLTDPHTTVHQPHDLCAMECSHATSECGLWNPEPTKESK